MTLVALCNYFSRYVLGTLARFQKDCATTVGCAISLNRSCLLYHDNSDNKVDTRSLRLYRRVGDLVFRSRDHVKI